MSTSQYPVLAAKPNRCMHEQRRRGLQTLFCVQQAGHVGRHLHDVHPGGSQWDSATRTWFYGKPVVHDPQGNPPIPASKPVTKVIEVPVNARSAENAILALKDAIETGRAPLPAGTSLVSIEESYLEFAPRPFDRVAIDADTDATSRRFQRSCFVLAMTISRP
jgi:hypothetical protein